MRSASTAPLSHAPFRTTAPTAVLLAVVAHLPSPPPLSSRLLWPCSLARFLPSRLCSFPPIAKMGEERPSAIFDEWDFRPGRRFEREVFHCFGSLVHHPSSSPHGSFLLLVVFCRSSFRLSEELVGMALHSVLGSSPGGFHISCVKPCHFRFSVASKKVGLLVSSLKRVTTAHFDVYFHL
jgi:hypothetical protein